MEDMELCPFCGSTKLKTERTIKSTHYSRNRGLDHVVCSVRCNKCHARGGTASGYTRNAMYKLTEDGAKLLEPMAQIEARAVAAWNRRVADGKKDNH